MSRLFPLLLPFIIPLAASAATFSVESAANYAVRHNPNLAAARMRIAEARGRLLGTGRLANPELEIEASQNVRMPERMLGIGLMQRFPLTARLKLEKSVSRAQLAAAEAEVRDAERRMAAEVRAAAIKLVAVRAQRQLREKQLANSREQTEFLSKRVEAGEASAVDVLQLELDGRQLGVELLELAAERATLAGQLRPLLGLAPSDTVEVTGGLAVPAAVPGRSAGVDGRPDLKAHGHMCDAARHSVTLARARKWEDVGVGVAASVERMEDAPEGLANDYFAGLKVIVPLPLWNKNEGQIAEATAAEARAELERTALAATIRAEAEAARGEMAALAEVVRETDADLLPKAARIEEQLRNSYTSGQAPLTEVLRARARQLELAQRRIVALRDYHLARARHDAALGRNIPAMESSGK